MGLDLTRVHHYVREPGTMSVRLQRTTPYIRFFQKGEVPIFLQNGKFWYEGGQVVPELPPWCIIEMQKCSKEALKEAGYNDDPKSIGQSRTDPVGNGKTSSRAPAAFGPRRT